MRGRDFNEAANRGFSPLANFIFGGNDASIVAQPTVNGATQSTAPLPAGVTYYWRARSINTYGEKGNWSGYRSFKVTQ